MRTRGAWTITIALGVFVACEDRSGGDKGGSELLAVCTGSFVCDLGGSKSTRVELSRAGPDCRMGAVVLQPDHTVFDPGSGQTTGRWEGDANAFSICDAKGKCTRCRLDSGYVQAPGTCGGFTPQCETLSVSECMVAPGCSVGGGRCGGMRSPCTALSERSACLANGCSWNDGVDAQAP